MESVPSTNGLSPVSGLVFGDLIVWKGVEGTAYETRNGNPVIYASFGFSIASSTQAVESQDKVLG